MKPQKENRENIISLEADGGFVDATPKASSAMEKNRGWVGNHLKRTLDLQKPCQEIKREATKWQQCLENISFIKKKSLS